MNLDNASEITSFREDLLLIGFVVTGGLISVVSATEILVLNIFDTDVFDKVKLFSIKLLLLITWYLLPSVDCSIVAVPLTKRFLLLAEF